MDGFGGEAKITRRSDNHHPSVWGDHFLAYANLLGANEWEEKEHKDLKEGVRKMLVISPSKSLQKLELINTIQLLGVSYHFEHEIEESLSEICNGYEEWIGEFGESDLHVVALSFRLLRQQGYYVSSDVFRKFTDDQGDYKTALVNDTHGLLSLYEAAQFIVHDEEILDEAINFSTTHLNLLLPKLSNSLSMQVSCALKYPINKTIARVATRKYMWNIDATENLASYTKLYYTALLHFYNEVEKELEKENKSFRVNFAISEMKKLVRAYFQEAKWYHGNTVPKMEEEYMKNGIQTSTIPTLATASWLGMDDEATKEAFEWITTEPPILVASSNIARLLNDIVSHEREIERGDVASSIDCYMNEHDATKEESYMEIRKIVENNWKDLNRGCLKPTTVPRVLLMPILNLCRTSEFYYKDGDAYTFSKNNLKDVISMVLVDPIEV
ncbi:probable terpene synthase 3 [Solanum pennellii]|uniref:Probable terpene synthase 3 n=1 Tax=Solanum pennellii TaxID=28526 RepID=A0ABM1VF18_SOLPN|nr:probable terpene synthase 3 [Solanum pennellii]